jgi:hypothetical protein
MSELISVDFDENYPKSNTGDFFISGKAIFGKIGVGTESPRSELEVVGDVTISGIVTATQFVGLVTYSQTSFYSSTSGIATYSEISGIATYSETSGIATYATTSGVSTVAQGLTGTPNISVGIITASSYVSSGSTVVYAGINSSFVDANTTETHYITFDTNSTSVNISNFTSGREVTVLARNTAGGGRNMIFRTGLDNTAHSPVPQIINSSGNTTNGTISIPSGSGIMFRFFNINGTVIGAY